MLQIRWLSKSNPHGSSGDFPKNYALGKKCKNLEHYRNLLAISFLFSWIRGMINCIYRTSALPKGVVLIGSEGVVVFINDCRKKINLKRKTNHKLQIMYYHGGSEQYFYLMKLKIPHNKMIVFLTNSEIMANDQRNLFNKFI